MAKRSKDWNIGLAEDLLNPEFAREFLLAAIEEDVSVRSCPWEKSFGLSE